VRPVAAVAVSARRAISHLSVLAPGGEVAQFLPFCRGAGRRDPDLSSDQSFRAVFAKVERA
jgi:hypothetical protein